MARPTLFQCPKFRRLVYLLGAPVPHVIGYLECLWSVAYECGNPIIGDTVDIEIAAQWPGEPGKLTDALLNTKFIDILADGRYEIHDFWHHAPEYVKKRRDRELGRIRRGDKLRGDESEMSGVRRPADNGCRAADSVGRTADNGRHVRPRGHTPAPAPPPTPSPNTPYSPPIGGPTANKQTRRLPAVASDPDGFAEFWQEYPRRTARQNAVKAWAKLKPDADLQILILRAVRNQKQSPAWQRDGGQFIPHASTWLNGRRWEDEPPIVDQPDPFAWRREFLRDEADGPDPCEVIVEPQRDTEGNGGRRELHASGGANEGNARPANG